MNKLFVSVLIFTAFLIVVLLLLKNSGPEQPQVTQPVMAVDTEVDLSVMDFPEPPEGAIVFDLKYRALDGDKDELRYNSYWGFGQRDKETPFIKDLKKNHKELTIVHNRYFKGAEWSAIEIKNNEVVAFYFDLNADGKVSDNEKILPLNTEQNPSRTTTEFVTPDFMMNTEDNHQVPFRALLQVRTYNNNSSSPSCMWSPSCILEGKSDFDGEPIKLILYTSGFQGSFKEFGRCSYSLNKSEENIGRNLSRHTLSSIINYNGQFYRLKLDGSHEKGKMIRAVLEKYQGDTGALAVKLAGKTDLDAKLTSASISGSKDTTLRFNIPSGQAKLPTGAYKLDRGNLSYDTENGDQWRLDFTEGPKFAIETDQTCTMELGQPTLTVSAIDESKRYQGDVKEQAVYAKGIKILLSRKVTGKAGELYGRFSQKKKDSNSYTSIKPEIQIIDPDGKQIASTEMEYG